jgi:hypothetical protein
MAQLMSRLRAAVSALGHEGALANVVEEIGRAAAARHAVDQLELRMATVERARAPHAA